MNSFRRSFNMMVLLTSIQMALYAQDSLTSAQANGDTMFHKGNYSLSGSFSYSYTSFPNSDRKTSNLILSPFFLRFMSQSFAIGGELVYLVVKTTAGGVTSQSSFTGVGPMFRYYFMNSPLPSFVAGSVIATGGETSLGGSSFSNSGSSFASIAIGCDYFVASNLSLEPFVQYRFTLSGGSPAGETFAVGFSFATFVR